MALMRRKSAARDADAVQAGVGVTDAADKIDWEARYNAERDAFAAYRAEKEAAALRLRREEGYRALLAEAGVPERKWDAVMRLTELDALALDEEGGILGAEELLEQIREEWREIIPVTCEVGAEVAHSPMLRCAGMTKKQIMSISNRDARRAAIAENMELFR